MSRAAVATIAVLKALMVSPSAVNLWLVIDIL
jgi:hypothetical protein